MYIIAMYMYIVMYMHVYIHVCGGTQSEYGYIGYCIYTHYTYS